MQTNYDILNFKVMSNPLPAAKSRGVKNYVKLFFYYLKLLLHLSERGAVPSIFQFGHSDTHVVLFKKSFLF